MTSQELVELAVLDALGLLDDADAEAFDTAFRAAAPHVQAHLRREQTRMANIEHLLPVTEAPAALRARVLAAVRAARDSAEPDREVARRLVHTAGREGAPRRRSARVTAVWRTLALGAAAAAVVFGGLTVQMRADYLRLEKQLRGDALLDKLAAEFGPDFVDALVDRDTQRLTMVATERAPAARAAVWTHPEWTGARFFAVNLPHTEPGKTYRLAVLDDKGEPVQVLTTFSFSGRLINEEIPIDVMVSSPRLAVVGDDAGKELILELPAPAPGA